MTSPLPHLRAAEAADIPAMEALIARSGVALSVGFYSPEQAEALTRHVFGVDTQLVADRTYFVIEDLAGIVACGGWSKRRTLYGADRTKTGPDPLLDPAREPARIRAFFVDPGMARQGLGSRLMEHCMGEAERSGFRSLELAATLPGVPLYLAHGFTVLERFDLPLPGNLRAPLARMGRSIGPEGGPEGPPPI